MQHFVALCDRKQIDPLPLDALKVYTFSSIAEGSFFYSRGMGTAPHDDEYVQ